MSISILLPAASAHRDCDEGATTTFVVELLDTVTNFLTHNPTARVVCGMDADDPARQLFAGKLALSESNILDRVACHTFHTADLQQAKNDALEQGSVAIDERSVPLCWMWGQLAQLAIRTFQTELLVLLGDDVEMRPPTWVNMVSGKLSGPWTGYLQVCLGCTCTVDHCSTLNCAMGQTADAFRHDQHLHCLILRDNADPGFPSFPVIRSNHIIRFGGSVVPKVLSNQGGDPFLMELYWSIGGVQSMHAVTVVNKRGGYCLHNFARQTKLELSTTNCCFYSGLPELSPMSTKLFMLQEDLSFVALRTCHLCTSVCNCLTLCSSVNWLRGKVTFSSRHFPMPIHT